MVVAIITLLVSILLPALGKAREEARTVVCMSNMRNVNIALEFYCADWSDVMPITRGSGKVQNVCELGQPGVLGWACFVMLGGYAEDHRIHPEAIMEDDRWSDSFFFCPDKARYAAGTKTMFWPHAASTYSHTLLAGIATTGDTKVQPGGKRSRYARYRNGQYGPYKVSEIGNASSTLRLTEGAWQWDDVLERHYFSDYFADGKQRSPGAFYNNSDPYKTVEWRLHGGCSPLLFFDGHIERFSMGNAPSASMLLPCSLKTSTSGVSSGSIACQSSPCQPWR